MYASPFAMSSKRFLDSGARLRGSAHFYEGFGLNARDETISGTGRRATMKQVAALAGVSVATVSRVVNDDAAVRSDLAARVRDAVVALGYRHNVSASALRRADGQSASIGVIVEDVSNPFFSLVQRGIEEVARERGVLTLAGSSDEQPERERALAEAFGARGVDGLIIAPAATDHGFLLRDRAAGVAIVFVDRPGRFIDADAVLTDNAGGAERAVTAPHRRRARADRLPRRPAGDPHRRRAPARLRARPRAPRAADRPRARAPHADARRERVRGDAGAAARATRRRRRSSRARTSSRSTPCARCTPSTCSTRSRSSASTTSCWPTSWRPRSPSSRRTRPRSGARRPTQLFARLDGDDGPTREIVLPTELVVRGSGELPGPRAGGTA